MFRLKTVYVITTGGTIEKSLCERTGKVANTECKIERYLDQLRLPHTHVEVLPLFSKDSLEITAEDRQLLLVAIRERLQLGCPIVITHGTDTVLETARELERNLPELPVPIIFTGAMSPLGFEHSDGIQNLTESLLAAELLPPGIHLVVHNRVFNIHSVRKDRDRKTFVPVERF
jgi:L-asparaginase